MFVEMHKNFASITKAEQQGFTLLEVLVSMLIFLVVSATMATSFVSHLKRNTYTELRTLAMGAAQQVLDETRLIDPGTMPTSGSVNSSVNVSGKTFNVVTSYCTNSTYCISASNRHIRIQINYAGDQIFETETVFTRLR